MDYNCKKCDICCNAIHFQRNFENWTSENDDIDKFIQNIQLLEHKDRLSMDPVKTLEWVPYDRFYNITCIAKDESCEVYKANWIDGNIYKWDYYNQNWKRQDSNMLVILKSLNNSTNDISEFMNEV